MGTTTRQYSLRPIIQETMRTTGHHHQQVDQVDQLDQVDQEAAACDCEGNRCMPCVRRSGVMMCVVEEMSEWALAPSA